jgi:hypothetical protein
MKAWSWFVVVPIVLAAAYWATPMLVTSLTGHNAAAVTITQISLPDEVGKPAAKAADAAAREINYAAFPRDESIVQVKSTGPVFALQSVMLSDGVGVAVVDGKPVRKGDQVGGGYRVFKIEPLAVWLAITRTTTVPVSKHSKRLKKVTKDEFKVLHFPIYRDADMEAMLASDSTPKPAILPPPAPGQNAGQMDLDKNYKQILEMLKL